MLGTKECPSLLVYVGDNIDRNHFKFWVVNGCWEGTFYNGHITVHDCPSGDFSNLDQVKILSDNQDRLRGDYNQVFAKFDDPDYVAPPSKVVDLPASWDDDIPF